MSAERHGYAGPLHVEYEYDPECTCRGTGRHDEDDYSCGWWAIDPTEPSADQLAEMLRARAASDAIWAPPVELLIAHRHWLYASQFRAYIDAFLGYAPTRTVGHPDTPMALIHWAQVCGALDRREFPASSSELAVLRIAASLGGREVTVNLRSALVGLDHRNSQLVAKAIAQAAGIHQVWA